MRESTTLGNAPTRPQDTPRSLWAAVAVLVVTSLGFAWVFDDIQVTWFLAIVLGLIVGSCILAASIYVSRSVRIHRIVAGLVLIVCGSAGLYAGMWRQNAIVDAPATRTVVAAYSLGNAFYIHFQDDPTHYPLLDRNAWPIAFSDEVCTQIRKPNNGYNTVVHLTAGACTEQTAQRP